MIRIAVIDDDKCFCETLTKQILEINSGFEVRCYQSMDSFSEHAAGYNIAVIDILLDEGSGIEKASVMSSRFPLLNIIFVSIERDFFQDVYKVDHTYFMVKPVSDNELRQALELCCKKLNEQQLYIRQNSGTIFIDLNTVAYLEGMLKKTIVHYADGTEQLLNIPLRSVEDQLCNTGFIRTHQSYIVNLRYVIHASKNRLAVQDTYIPVSRKYTVSTEKAISRYLSGNMLPGSKNAPAAK